MLSTNHFHSFGKRKICYSWFIRIFVFALWLSRIYFPSAISNVCLSHAGGLMRRDLFIVFVRYAIYSAFHKSACGVSLLFGALWWRYMIQSCIVRMHGWLEKETLHLLFVWRLRYLVHRLKSSQLLCNQALSFAVENIAKLSEFENLETFHDFWME